jgi:hypothetical protein
VERRPRVAVAQLEVVDDVEDAVGKDGTAENASRTINPRRGSPVEVLA